MKKRILSLAILLALLVSIVPMALATTDPWPEDAAPSRWAQAYVREAYRQNLVPEDLMGRFNQPITRLEFAELAVSFYYAALARETTPPISQYRPGVGITGRWGFTDTDNESVMKMAYVGVLRGVGNNRFNPDGLITRQESAAILSRLANVTGLILPVHTPTFYDNSAVAGWAMDSVGQMQASGIMGGVGGNRFAPQGQYTIEQSIATMVRLYHYDLESVLDAFLAGICLAFVEEFLGVAFTVNSDPHAFLWRGAWQDAAGEWVPDVRSNHWRLLTLDGTLNMSDFPHNGGTDVFAPNEPAGSVALWRRYDNTIYLLISLGFVNEGGFAAVHFAQLDDNPAAACSC